MTDALQEMAYLPGGTVAHVVRPTFRTGSSFLKAYCGRSAHYSWWRGNLGQAEVTHLAALPMCKRCAKALPR